MSKIKMSDLLDLPYGRISRTMFGDKSAKNILTLVDGAQYQVEYICTAINSYDPDQAQIAGLTLDLGLAHLATEAKKGLLESCEIALSERDEKLDAQNAQIAGLCSVLEQVAGLVDTDMGDAADWLIDNTDHIRRLIGEARP